MTGAGGIVSTSTFLCVKFLSGGLTTKKVGLAVRRHVHMTWSTLRLIPRLSSL